MGRRWTISQIYSLIAAELADRLGWVTETQDTVAATLPGWLRRLVEEDFVLDAVERMYPLSAWTEPLCVHTCMGTERDIRSII